MTVDRGSPVATGLSYLAHAFQAGIVAILAYAVVRENFGLAFNAGLSLLVAAFPTYVRYRYGDHLHPALAAWIALAALLHVVGITGPYVNRPWYDQVAHGVSGAMIAGVGYALVQTVDAQYESVELPPRLRFVFILVFVVAVGVVWEVAEFSVGQIASAVGAKPPLVQYGLSDVIFDLVADVVGGLIVALLGAPYFDGLRSVIARHLGGSTPSGREEPEA